MIVRVQSMPPLFNEVFGRDRVLDELMPCALKINEGNAAFLRIDVAESKDKIQIVAEVPGVPKENIKIQLNDGILTISGERKAPESDKGTWLRNEIPYGIFSRSIELPERVDAGKVSAEYSNGVLRIALPKLEDAQPREISIR